MQLSEITQMPAKHVRCDSFAHPTLVFLIFFPFLTWICTWEYVNQSVFMSWTDHHSFCLVIANNSSPWRSSNFLIRVTCKWSLSSCLIVLTFKISQILDIFVNAILYRWMNLKAVKKLVETDALNLENYPVSKVSKLSFIEGWHAKAQWNMFTNLFLFPESEWWWNSFARNRNFSNTGIHH